MPLNLCILPVCFWELRWNWSNDISSKVRSSNPSLYACFLFPFRLFLLFLCRPPRGRANLLLDYRLMPIDGEGSDEQTTIWSSKSCRFNSSCPSNRAVVLIPLIILMLSVKAVRTADNESFDFVLTSFLFSFFNSFFSSSFTNVSFILTCGIDVKFLVFEKLWEQELPGRIKFSSRIFTSISNL